MSDAKKEKSGSLSGSISGAMKNFSGAMIQPILFLSVIGMVMAICVVLRMDFMPDLIATAANFIYLTCMQAGISNLSVLLCIGLTVAFAKTKKTDAAVVSMISFLVFLYANNSYLDMTGQLVEADSLTGTGQDTVLGVQVVNMGVLLGIILGCMNGWIFNKFCNVEFPEAVHIYGGSRFACLISIFATMIFAVLACYIWPPINSLISSLADWIAASGNLGLFVYGFLNRFLIPTGLHHLVYMPFDYTAVGGTLEIAGEVYEGATTIWTAEMADVSSLTSIDDSIKWIFIGFAKIFGSIGLTWAFISTAKPERKADVKARLIPAMFVAVLAGITEPLEFQFLFASPLLWLVHSLLDGLFEVLLYVCGFRLYLMGGIVSSLPYIIAVPSELTKWYVGLGLGIIAIFVWYFSFKFLILKFDLKTPGREDDEPELAVATAGAGTATASASAGSSDGGFIDQMGDVDDIIEGLGGAENIADLENCITRLRVVVKDGSLIDEDRINRFKNSGIVRKENTIQIIIGMKVDTVAQKVNDRLGRSEE